jgi:hypothetical protein
VIRGHGGGERGKREPKRSHLLCPESRNVGSFAMKEGEPDEEVSSLFNYAFPRMNGINVDPDGMILSIPFPFPLNYGLSVEEHLTTIDDRLSDEV